MLNERCDLCRDAGGRLIWSDERCRVVLVADDDYPGYCRVIWNEHVAEFSDLLSADRQHLMEVVYSVEKAVRSVQNPDKINLASLGNMTPHLHWHIIPRWRNDRNYPQAIWASAVRDGDVSHAQGVPAALTAEICKLLSISSGRGH